MMMREMKCNSNNKLEKHSNGHPAGSGWLEIVFSIFNSVNIFKGSYFCIKKTIKSPERE